MKTRIKEAMENFSIAMENCWESEVATLRLLEKAVWRISATMPWYKMGYPLIESKEDAVEFLEELAANTYCEMLCAQESFLTGDDDPSLFGIITWEDVRESEAIYSMVDRTLACARQFV